MFLDSHLFVIPPIVFVFVFCFVFCLIPSFLLRTVWFSSEPANFSSHGLFSQDFLLRTLFFPFREVFGPYPCNYLYPHTSGQSTYYFLITQEAYSRPFNSLFSCTFYMDAKCFGIASFVVHSVSFFTVSGDISLKNSLSGFLLVF